MLMGLWPAHCRLTAQSSMSGRTDLPGNQFMGSADTCELTGILLNLKNPPVNMIHGLCYLRQLSVRSLSIISKRDTSIACRQSSGHVVFP